MATVIPAISVKSSMIVSNIPESTAFAPNYSSGTTYAKDVYASVLTGTSKRTAYKSLQNGNLNHPIATSPLWWKEISVFYEPYNVSTPYVVGDKVQTIVDDLVLIYTCIQDGTGKPLNDPTYWLYSSMSNRMAMFDPIKNMQSEVESPMIVTVSPNQRCDSIALDGLEGESVQITVVSGGSTVYDEIININTRNTINHYTYAFGKFGNRRALVRLNLPPFTNAQITITIARGAGKVKCGNVATAMAQYLGATQYEAEDDVLNFSTFDRTPLGASTLIPRRNAPKPTLVIWSNRELVNSIRDVREFLNAKPAFWVGLEDDTHPYFESLSVMGVYKQFKLNLKHETKAVTTISLEGF